MSSTELISLVEQYREAQQLIEAAQAELEAIKARVMAEMDRRGVSQMDAGTHRIRLQQVTTAWTAKHCGPPSPTWPPASSARPRPAALPLPDPSLHPIASIVR